MLEEMMMTKKTQKTEKTATTKKAPVKRKAPIRKYAPLWAAPERYKARGYTPSMSKTAKEVAKVVLFAPLLIGAAVIDRVFR